jgi:hypothetical protein
VKRTTLGKQIAAGQRLAKMLDAWADAAHKGQLHRARMLWWNGHRLQKKLRVSRRRMDRLIDALHRRRTDLTESELERFYVFLRARRAL